MGVINVWCMCHLKEINGVGDIELIFALINQAKSLAKHFECMLNGELGLPGVDRVCQTNEMMR